MYFKISIEQENYLLRQPETGMGYQVVEASTVTDYSTKNFLVLNSEIVIEMDGMQERYVSEIISKGISFIKEKSKLIILNSTKVLNEYQFCNRVNETNSRYETENGATANEFESADGSEIFIRLSAFQNDKRIDAVKKCLLPGSYTTTVDDYLSCKNKNDDPVERYALPGDDKIQCAFHIRPQKDDTLQRGTVQPAHRKRGGGQEVYFKNGTGAETFLYQTAY
jgi:hypothetical protein